MKPMVSKKGSQQVVVLGGIGCVTISATDRKKHVSNSVTVFDELLPGLIARLSAIAASRRTPRAPDACPYCAGKGEFVNVIGKALRCNHCAGTGQRR